MRNLRIDRLQFKIHFASNLQPLTYDIINLEPFTLNPNLINAK